MTEMAETLQAAMQDVKDLAEYDNEFYLYWQRKEWIEAQLYQLHELDGHVNEVFQAIQDLANGRLSPHFLSATGLQEVFTDVRRRAEDFQGSPAITNPNGIFQLPTTFTTHGHRLTIAVHVPVVLHRLNLYQFRPTPLLVTKNAHTTTVVPAPRRELLAHNEEVHREMDHLDLLPCWRQNSIYICPGLAAYHLQPKQTCLGALFVADLKSIGELCPIQAFQEAWSVEEVSNHRLAVYFRDPVRATKVCPDNRRTSLPLHGHHHLDLEGNCSLTADDLRITAHQDVLLRAPFVLMPQWDATPLLLDQTPESLHQLRQRVEAHRIRAAKEISDLVGQAWMVDQVELLHQGGRDHQERHTVLTIIGGATVLILACAVVLFASRWILCWWRARAIVTARKDFAPGEEEPKGSSVAT